MEEGVVVSWRQFRFGGSTDEEVFDADADAGAGLRAVG